MNFGTSVVLAALNACSWWQFRDQKKGFLLSGFVNGAMSGCCAGSLRAKPKECGNQEFHGVRGPSQLCAQVFSLLGLVVLDEMVKTRFLSSPFII